MSAKSIQDLKDDTASLHFGDRWRWVTQSRLVGFIACALFNILVCSGIILTVRHDRAMAAAAAKNVAQPPPSLFIRLEGVEGLDLCTAPPAPPAFHLAVDADCIPASYRYCSGGGSSMLRVSYHGMILAWGSVPWFCVEGSPTDDGVDGVVTVEARAEGAVLREEVRCLVQGELSLTWRERWRDWDIFAARLLFKGNATEEYSICLVQ